MSQAAKLSTLKADDVVAFWSEHSLDKEFEMEWKKKRHKKGGQVNSVHSKSLSLLKLVNAFDVNGVMGGVSATIPSVAAAATAVCARLLPREHGSQLAKEIKKYNLYAIKQLFYFFHKK